MTTHEPRPAAAEPAAPAAVSSLLVTAAAGPAEADRALAEGADLIDITGLAAAAATELSAHLPAGRLWTGSPVAMDVDADDVAAADQVAAAVAAAAVGTWLGVPAIRTRHVRAVRRAIDMTQTVAGNRLPALTTRGLA